MSNIDRTREKINGVTKCIECGKSLYCGEGKRCSTCMVRNWKKNNPERARFLKHKHSKGENARRHKRINIIREDVKKECMESIPATMKICRVCSGVMGYYEIRRGCDRCKDCIRHRVIKKIIGGWVVALGKDSRKHRMHNTLKAIKMKAKRRGIPFDISVADLDMPKLCPVFGVEIFYDKRKLLMDGGSIRNHPQIPSIDRLIPELGYVKGNVFVMSLKANIVKNNGTAEEHEKIAAFMRKNIMVSL